MRLHCVLVVMATLLGGCASWTTPDELSPVDTANLADLLQTAEREYTLGNLEVADKLLAEAEKMAPNNERLLFRRGTIAFHRGDLDLSASLFDRCLKVNPVNGKAHYNLATIRLHQSSEHFKAFMENSPPQANRKPIYQLLRAIDGFAETSESAGSFSGGSGSLHQP
jgi:tetratricopeptide (TPR) repeat protein